MDLSAVSEEDLGRTPCVSTGCDPTTLRLTPSEGYLLSRIDGHTPWRLLRQIGGLTPEEVDTCIEVWLAEAIIEMGGFEHRPRTCVKRIAEPVLVPGVIDESSIDQSLDLDVEVQRRILDMESRLSGSYAELLGVSRDADTKAIKKAYRKLSRDFHPDRYFRKEIGDFKLRLDAIFKKIFEAYELLSDPATRGDAQKAMASNASSPGVPLPGQPAAPLTPVERLRQRMSIKIPDSLRREQDDRARGLHDSARSSLRSGRLLEAASSIRLAISFDPHADAYRKTFGEIQAAVAEERIETLFAEASKWTEPAEFTSGLKLCEEALLYRPHDPKLNATAAELAMGLKDIEQAHEYAERAIEHSPDVGRYHRLMGEVLIARGNKGHAVRQLGKAVELDPSDGKAKKLLDKLRNGPRCAVDGGGG